MTTATGLDPALRALCDESVYILREAVGQCERPVLLFSGGKDSALLLRLAELAFAPAAIPFPCLHVDTGHNFTEVLEFRDKRVAELGLVLHVASVQESIDRGRVTEAPDGTRNALQTTTLLDALARHRFDAVFGGARRDEEKARAKERVFSVRDALGGWDPRAQRPELWDLYCGRVPAGSQVRVFPLSNWTEADVWRFIAADGLDLPPLYYAHRREVVRRGGLLIAVTPWTLPRPGEKVVPRTVRYRTVGDATCTAAVESSAATPAEVLAEIARSTVTERGATRADDLVSDSSMEDRKRAGYF